MSAPIRVLFATAASELLPDLLGEMLENGFDVVSRQVNTSQGLAEALRVSRWDIVVTEATDPGLDGVTTHRLLHQLSPDTPLVVIGAKPQEPRPLPNDPDITPLFQDAVDGGGTYFAPRSDVIPTLRRALKSAGVTRGQRRRRHGLSGEKARIEVGVFYTADANGQPTWFSANVAPLLGDGAEQWIASPAQFIERIHAADRTRFQARLENTLPGEPRACLFRWLDATNQYRTIVDQAVRLPGPDSSAQTIVGRFRPASLPQLPATGPLGLLDQSPDGVVVLDGECRIRHWSAGAEQLFGWSADEVVNRDAASIFGDSHSIVWENALHLTQETGHWRGEMSLAHRNGDRRTIDSRWCQTFVEGHADGYMLFLTDVTESRKHEAQTRSSRRLVEMADLIRGISHDLNNVLTPLMTGLDLLKMAGVADETRQEIITAMAADAARGAQLVKAIRTLCTPSHKVAPGEDVVEPRPTNGRHRPPSEGIDSVNTIYPSGKGTCILLVDDEVSVRVLTRLTLEAYGFRILMASDGVEATTAFARHQDAIRLALVDLIMPIWDGVETIRRLRGLNPVLPVVMMSGDADASARVSGIAACQVLYKPFTALDLMKTVSAALGLACGVGA